MQGNLLRKAGCQLDAVCKGIGKVTQLTDISKYSRQSMAIRRVVPNQCKRVETRGKAPQAPLPLWVKSG